MQHPSANENGILREIKCAIARQMTRRRTRKNPRPSGVYKSSRRADGKAEPVEIERELREKWRVSLYQLRNTDGKKDKKQWYICTIGYWDIVDDRYHPDFEGSLFAYAEKRIETLFPDALPEESERLSRIIRERFAPVRAKVIGEYRASDEYYHRMLQNLVRRRKEETEYGCSAFGGNGSREKDREKEGAPGGNGASRKNGGRSSFRSASASTSAEQSEPESKADDITPDIPTETEIALELIHAGFKKIAAKYHPDLGGDTERMQRLNAVRAKLVRLSKVLTIS